MKAVLLLLSFILLSLGLFAQAPDENCRNNEFLKYYNGFQHTKYLAEKQHVALSHARNLAKACPPSLRSLFHTFYAQSFSKRITGNRPNTAERNLLVKLLQDTSQVIAQALEPIVFWVKAQENENNVAELSKLTNEYIRTQLEPNNWHENRTARYALLIYQVIHPKPELANQAQVLLGKTIAGLETQLKGYVLPGESVHNQKRAWYRYLYAYSNFLQGAEYARKGNKMEAEKYYRTASEYSPDDIDKNSKPGYHYDIAFLGTADFADGFKENYLSFLETNLNPGEALKTLTELSLSDAAHIPRLQAFYNQHYTTVESYETYWEKQLKKLPVAPAFTLKQLNNTAFSLEVQKGKWVLLDFWGTWCEPCIKEMPQMQGFYREITSKYADRIILLTIACQDTEMKVKTFLNKNRYHFPVAMSDGKVEQSFSVTGYPSKFLITPEGNMFLLAGADNWVEQVKLYCQLK